MKKINCFVLSLIIAVCFLTPFVSACSDKKIHISYSHITLNKSISVNELPRGNQKTVEPGFVFEPLSETNNLKPIEYRVYTT